MAPDNWPMEIVMHLVDFILHVDKYLGAFVSQYGPWVYALLFIIVFVETGVVIMPFLPGDSLLFVVGAMAGAGHMHLGVACAVLLAAAILGPVQLQHWPLHWPQGVSVGGFAPVQPQGV